MVIIITELIQLTQYLQISNAAHILYVYETKNKYLNNLMAYIKTGVARGHHVIIIEDLNLYKQAEERIKKLFSREEQKLVYYLDNKLFYGYYQDFHAETIIKHFTQLLKPFLDEKMIVRTWAHVQLKKADDIYTKIMEFEHLADKYVNKFKIMSVCAYNGSEIPASLHINMMKSHEYLMTDNQLTRSLLYRID